VRGSQSKRRSPSRALVVTFIALVGALLPAVGLLNEGVAGAATTSTNFYLALGASESVGVQPTAVLPRGQRTDQGYANDLITYEAARGVAMQLTQLGCPGETTMSMMSGVDRCYTNADTQFNEALSFLRSHQGASGIVTIDLGFNDVHHCFHDGVVDQACVQNKINAVSQMLPTILTSLKNVSGPGVTFVGLGHYDPYLAYALNGPAGQQFAQATVTAIDSLNAALRSVYANAGVAMATVGPAFEIRDLVRVRLTGRGLVPENVANVCALTWMCQAPPFGPNLHPNAAGYATIATAIESVLKAPW